ncbi:hypothetical protein SSBR45G_72110 [Bradyrhizobium sp. SSBR45G]|uniref:hypothetical protein n=1 Tax=unclassified Bradyrhizobium TaxID=2631580 RepID=UPI002342B274|nr:MULTISPECIES: hypothetical protein [unclassified Bradyrhizobium]GLH82302.1 hypothetical protein SSBR45G_72110 [Bradyrhizobium sp. SSBR45G]GLH89708.1 hypothetical protein SSBR45R_71690 [Bradyrhizobium sp. SSBR45R]
MSELWQQAIAAPRLRLFACGLLLLANSAVPARADDGIADVHALPRLEGAVEDTSRPDKYRVVYRVPTPVEATNAATQQLLGADGWVRFVRPLEERNATLNYKKGKQGLTVYFTGSAGRPGQSEATYSATRIYANLPFPDGAADLMFDETRPYLSCIVATPLDATKAFFAKEMTALGWQPLTAETAARWPNADLSETAPNGVRAFYGHDDSDGYRRQNPVMLSLTRRDDGKTHVEIRIAPFALPTELEAGDDRAGLPMPKPTKSSQSLGSATSPSRQAKGAVMAELPAVLAFYTRELPARGWRIEAAGPGTPDDVTLKVASTDETGTLKLVRKYDFTMVELSVRATEAALAARAKAKKDADDRFMADAAAMAKQVIAADEVRRATQAGAMSDAPVKALADNPAPIALPETAEAVTFDGSQGRLEFNSTSSVKALAGFFRGTLKPAGWKEAPTVIDNPTMARLEFSAKGKSVAFTIMQMGPKVNVTADGTGLLASAKPAAGAQPAAAAQAAAQPAKDSTPLEADPSSALPVPKERSSTSLSTSKAPGFDTPVRLELEASVPADLDAVLAFYRAELTKRGWQEKPEGAQTGADRVRLAFASPQGPALLTLGRARGETSVNLVQKNAEAAAKTEILPKPGQARLMLGNIGDADAVLTINKQSVKIAAGTGSPKTPKGPLLDLPPGKYRYEIRIAGRAPIRDAIELGAGDAWGLMVGPTGQAMPLPLY